MYLVINPKGFSITAGLALALLMASSLFLSAAPPDLTSGGVPSSTITTNLGPTGLRGWVYHENIDTSASRQIQIQAVDAGSPADGILAVNDVILGASGTGAAPVDFTDDARVSFANAVNDAEARNPAELKVLRWRAGTTTVQTITLRFMGAYSATAPYNCPKSAKILEEGLQAIMTTGETAGAYSLGTLSLLAANDTANPNNAARQTRAQAEARALIPDAATLAKLSSGEPDPLTEDPWGDGPKLIVLTEYYLQTSDPLVLPAIEAYSKAIIGGQNLFGTYSHRYARKWRDGSPNGPMRNFYGTVNSASMPGWLGLLLTKECGIVNPDLDPAIERASRFYAYYSGKGAIPYGEHDAYWQGHENNGKSGLAALCFELESHRAAQQKFFAKMAVAATSERDIGHTGPFFNHLWAPLGAAVGGEAAAASHFSRVRWMLDLNRRWDGLFISNRYGEDSIYNSYSDFRISTAALLTYALPLRQLHITGRGHDLLRKLTNQDVAEAEAVDGYRAASRTTSELMADLGSWSPRAQRGAAEELKNRPSEATALLPTLHAMATNTLGTSRVGATFALGYIGHATSVGILASLLTDPVNHVRFAAADALREMPQNLRAPHLNTVMAAAAANAAPLLPFNAEDPAHLAHARFGPLLFNSDGMVPTDLSGVDRNLLYPAIRAVAQNPVGICRSSLSRIYDNLNQTDYQALVDTVVYSAYELTPADKMFAYQDRNAAQRVLEKYNAAEGVPLCLLAIKDNMIDSSASIALSTLKLYAGGSKTVQPDPDVEAAMNFLIQTQSNVAEAQAVLAAIAGDPNPVPLQPLKSIQSTTADAPTLTLPVKSTTLRVTATDLAKGDSIYTWRKIHGAGSVTFSPNGTSDAKDAVAIFDGTPGQYLFEVKMSDSFGLTEVTSTVAITLYPPGGSLPTNNPPVANSQSPSVPQATPTPITLTGNDPEGFALNFRLKSQPTHGTLTGIAPYLVYTPDYSYIGADSFTFDVVDSEAQVSTAAAVNLTVTTVGSSPALPVLSGTGTSGNLAEYNEADGYRFQTGSSGLTVKWLGVYDAPNGGAGTIGDGLLASHRVSIWRESDRVLMAQTTVLTSDALAGSFRKHDITPVTLAANTGYVIAADYGGNGDRIMENAVPAEWGLYSGISNLEGRFGGPGGGMPSIAWTVMIGPNFGYTAVPIDNTAPTPNPLAFHQAPAAVSPSSITMVAVTAYDPNEVEYYFTCTGGGGHDSGWQDSPSYTDTGLTPGVVYSYTVKARDKSPAQNTTSSSTAASATISAQATLPQLVGIPRNSAQIIIPAIGMIVGNVTQATGSGLPLGTVVSQTPVGNQTLPLGTVVDLVVSAGDAVAPTPNPATFSVAPAATSFSRITMTATTGIDPSGVEYFFDETSGNPGATDSGWQSSPSYTDTGLAASTSYTYTVTIRDKSPAQNSTTASSPASATTLAAPVYTVWNVQLASDSANQIATGENYIGAATENTANSTWNRVASLPQTGMALKNSTGATTGVTLDFSGGSINTQNLISGDKIFNSRVGGGSTSTLTLKGLSLANSYDLIIYSDWWWQNGDALPITQTVGSGLTGTFFLNRRLTATNGTVLPLTQDTNPANITSGAGNFGNWMRVNGLSPSLAGELTFRLGDGANTPFNGFQLIATSLPPEADLLSLSLPSNPPSIQEAVINGTNVTLTVPYGTNVTNLAPTYALSPDATCTTPSGTALNFTTPQNYTVTSSDSLITKIYAVTVVIAPPLPEFTLTAPTTWDGRSTITAQPVISNLSLLQSNNGTNFTYDWSISGVAVTQTTSPSIMTLTRSQGSGPLVVTLTMNNGTENVTASTTITIQEPATDPWVERTPVADEKPVNNQFFARNPFTNLGTIFYRGTQSGTPDDVFLKVYKTPSGGSETLYATHRQALVGGTYDFTAQVEAGLFTYRVVYGTSTGGTDTNVATVTGLLCGDAYIIEGQSNAQATDNSEPQVDTGDPWIKTYDASLGWGPAYAKPTSPNWGSKVGFWGMKLAQEMVAEHSLPVCIVNGAVGGTFIAQHQPNPSDRAVGAGTYDIYANLLNRVTAARLTHGIRGIFWHQGESDCGTFGPILAPDYTAYQQNFLNMSSAWKQDYPNFQRYVICQVMPAPCGIGPYGDELREVQRTLPRLYSNMSIIDALGIVGYEGCHYSKAGYENFANRMLAVVSRDFYGAADDAVTAPNLKRAYFTTTARTAIALEFDQAMSWNSFSEPNYYVNDVANLVSSGSASGNIVTLQLTSAAAADATLDYLKDSIWNQGESVSSLLYGANAIPALTFANVPIGISPPSPDPMSFAIPPTAVTSGTIGMVATTATDFSSGPVQYLFEETTGNAGGTDSAWQASPVYQDSGLTDGLTYTYRVKARGTLDIEGGWSAEISALAGSDSTAPSPAPSFASPPAAQGETSISMTATTATDINGVEYYFDCTVGGGTDSGWQSGTQFIATGLTPSTSYTYVVRARDSTGNITTDSAPVSATTLTPDTTAPTVFTYNPAPGAVEVAAGANLVLTFDEEIVIGTGLITIKNLTDATDTTIDVTNSSEVSATGAVLTINPPTNLAISRNYAIQIASTAVKDLKDNFFIGIADDTTWSFTTVVFPYVWTQTAGGARNWTDGANWQGSLVPSPISVDTVDFSTVNITADTALTLGANRTARLWKFGDTSGSQNWSVNSGSQMILAGTTPTIEVKQNTATFNNVIAGSNGLTKTGAGTLTLTNGSNSYTGGTFIHAGTLSPSSSALGSSANTITFTGNGAIQPIYNSNPTFTQGIVINPGAIGHFNAVNQFFHHKVSGVVSGSGTLLIGGTDNSNGNVTLSNTGNSHTGIIQIGNGTRGGNLITAKIADGAGPVQLGGTTGTGNLTFSGTGAAQNFATRVFTLSGTTGGGTITNNGSHIVTISQNLAITANGAKTLTLGGSNTGANAFSGNIGNSASGATSLTKSGAGTWTLSGANTYTGNTLITTGTLALSSTGRLKFVLGASSGSNNSLTGAGTATINGDFVIDTSAADALASGTWTLENVTTLTGGAYGSGFQVFQTDGTTQWTDAGGNKWTKAIAAKTYTFDETTGILTLAPTVLTAPEIAVNQGGDIASGGSKVFSTTTIGSSNSLEFTINNTGDATLNLSASTPRVVVSGTNAADFAVTVEPAASVAAGGNTTFTVRFAPGGTSGGGRNVQISIGNNDTTGSEDPFIINISGTAQTPYEAWATGGDAFNTDANNDGVANGMAWLLGAGDKEAEAHGLLPKASGNASALVLEFNCLAHAERGGALLYMQHSSDMGMLDAWAESAVPDTVGSFTEGVVVFEVTDPAPAGGLLKVQATIPASQSNSGKLFGRLRTEQP